MTKQFKLTRDVTSTVSFGLPISKMRKLDVLLAPGVEAFIILGANDKYAFFFPGVQEPYLVSFDPNVDPAAPTGGQFNDTESLLNVGHIDTYNWIPSTAAPAENRIYVKALASNTLNLPITVLIGEQNAQ